MAQSDEWADLLDLVDENGGIGGDDTFRNESIQRRLDEHDRRITDNEKFRYIASGAMLTLMIVLGVDLATDILFSIF